MDQPHAPYGADESGLICGYLFDAAGPATALDSRAAAAAITELRGAGTPPSPRFLWLHFNLAHAGAARWLDRHAGLSPLIA